MKGRLIVIEGNDCSGKETQCKALIERLDKEGYEIFTMSFPRYDTPTGAIVGGPLLGKSYICPSFFDNPGDVPPKVAGLYYAADRLYHAPKIIDALNAGKIVVLDRYTTSNMAHQGGKMLTSEERKSIFAFYEELEFELLGLPRPNGVIMLHMPFENVVEMLDKRGEKKDGAESNVEYLRHSEAAYLEMKDLYGFAYVPCVENGTVRSIESIHEDVYKQAKAIIDGKESSDGE